MANYNLNSIVSDLKNNYTFSVSKRASFWNSVNSPVAFKDSDSTDYLNNREQLMIYAIYFLAYYGFNSWPELLAADKINNTVKQLRETYYDEMGEAAPEPGDDITLENLMAGLTFISQLPDFIKQHSFNDLLEDYAGRFKGPVNSQYSMDGYIERGASKSMTRYIRNFKH